MQVAALASMTVTGHPRVLVTYGSEREGTAEIARAIGDSLRERGLVVDCIAADRVQNVDAYDAFVIGGALYMNHWHRHARHFVKRFLPVLRERPVWCFSSGPLDPTAAERSIPPVRSVARVLGRVSARGHVTFGGRLSPSAHGVVASAMARTHAGDWRNWDQINAWAAEVGDAIVALPSTEQRPVYAPKRWILASMCFVVGIAAVFGGLALALRPDGSLLRMPLSYLEHASFDTYLVPGLLLFAVVGIGHLITGWLVIRHSKNADLAALASGSILILWIVAQMILLRTMNNLQIASLLVGLSIMGEALRRLSSWTPSSDRATT
jgi:menaquinone-dependent protoporphyrinogen oxidase